MLAAWLDVITDRPFRMSRLEKFRDVKDELRYHWRLPPGARLRSITYLGEGEYDVAPFDECN